MYCPRCGQQQQNINSRFCSRCRFLMTGLDDVVQKGGLPKEVLFQQNPEAISPRRRGLKQGALLFLSGIIIVPLVAVFLEMVNGEEELAAIAALLTFMGGIVRMVYALFQSGVPTVEHEGLVDSIKHEIVGKKTQQQNALPPQQSEPIPADFQPMAGNWRETSDLQAVDQSEKATKTLHDKHFQ